jgi:hypothetical protein
MPSPGIRPLRRGVSKGVEDGHPRNGHNAILGGTHPHSLVGWVPQGVEGAGMAGPGETLGSLWISLVMGICEGVAMDSLEYHRGPPCLTLLPPGVSHP